MKKRLLSSIIIASTLILAGCNGGQKASERENVWAEHHDTEDIEADSLSVGDVSLSTNKVIVPFQRNESGTATVQASLNGVAFNMLWDTGASITCISTLELLNLVKEGKVSQDDLLGSKKFQVADGSTVSNDIYNIKEILIKGENGEYLRLRDVEVAVSDGIEAPLLIGQNVISNLPKHFFNENKYVIEFDK